MWNHSMSLFALIIIICVVQMNCFNFNSDCDGCHYTRVKRGRYYSPTKSYRSYGYPNRGYQSLQPGYTAGYNDIGSYQNQRPYKVSKISNNEGLGDADINNLFKFLSKNDLDKIVDFAYGKNNYYGSDSYEISSPNYNNENIINQEYESNQIINALNARPSDSNYNYRDNHNINYYNQFQEPINYYQPSSQMPTNADHLSQDESNQIINTLNARPSDSNQYQEPMNDYQPLSQMPTNADQLSQDESFSFFDAYVNKDNNINPTKDNIIYTDSTMMQEEQLPKPSNLREDDYEAAFTNNVPTIAKRQSSYRLENVADLPVMDFLNSKLHSVDSYNVPHYSVISPGRSLKPPYSVQSSYSQSSLLSSSHINGPDVEVAPPPSAAQEQSDAHLKATKIWTHRSKGTAYTLHNDGTLSLKKPRQTKY